MNLSIFSFKKNLPYIIIAGIAVFMFRDIFAPGFMSGYDNSFHYYDAHYLTKTLIPQYHWISGWSMQGMAGMPIFVDYYQIGFWVVAFLNMALGLPLALSYKTMVLFSYFFLGAGFYKVASFRFGKMAALIVAACMMLQKNIYHDKILVGMWSNYLTIGLFFIFFYVLDKSIKSMTIRKGVITGFLMGLIILTHIFVAIFAFLLLFIYAVPYLIKGSKDKTFLRNFLIYILIPTSVAIALSSYYLYGFIIARDYFLRPGSEHIKGALSWAIKSLFGPVERCTDVLSTVIINIPVAIRTIFSFFGIYLFIAPRVRKKEKNDVLHFLASAGYFVLIALLLSSHIFAYFDWWRRVPVITMVQFARLIIYIQLGMYIFAAYGLSKFLQYFRKKNLVTAACIVLIACSVFFHYTSFVKSASRTLEQSPHMAYIHKIWEWVNENIAPGKSRIVYQNTIDNMDDPILVRSDVFALSGVFTKIPQIGVSRPASPFPQEQYMRTDEEQIFGKKLDKVDDTFMRNRMNSFNAKHIVSVEPKLRNRLNKSQFFIKEKDFGEFSIFRLKDFKSGWINFEKKAIYKNLELDNQRISVEIDNYTDNNRALMKFAYHPFWQAVLNGKPVKVEQDKDRFSLMSVSLPNKGNYRLELSFNSFNLLWVTVSLLTLAGSLTIIVCRTQTSCHSRPSRVNSGGNPQNGSPLPRG